MATSDPPPERLQAPVPCDGCETGAPGKHYCTVCRKTLCNKCEEFHSRLMQNHKVVPRSELGSAIQSVCGDHPQENVSLYCKKCKCPICTECVTGKHNEHKVTKLSTVVEEEKERLLAEVSKMEQSKLTSISTALSGLQADEDAFENKLAHAIQETDDESESIRTELDKIKSAVDKAHSERRQNLLQTKQAGLARFNNLKKEMKNKEDIAKREIEERRKQISKCHDNPAGFLKFSETTTGLAHELHTTGQAPSPMFHPPSKLNMSEILQQLNLQHISPPGSRSLNVKPARIISSFKAEVKGFPSVCTTSDGHAWIGGSESRKLVKVDITGKILQRRKTKHRTNNLTMMESGEILMNPHPGDSRTLIRLGTDDTKTVIYDVGTLLCNGVSVTSDQQILVCLSTGRLMRISSDGTNVEEIYYKGVSDSAVHAIELPDKTICISDWSIPGLVVIDKDGQQITTITQPLGRTNNKPIELACDRMGNILSTDFNNDCVYIINQNREVKELVGSSHGIKDPAYLDIDKDDNMWIAQTDGTINVVRYLE